MDLEKLDNVIEELNNQADKLVEFGKVYDEISKLKNDLVNSLQLLDKNNATVSILAEKVNNQLTEFQKLIELHGVAQNKRITEIYEDNKHYQKELDKSIFTRLEKHKSDIQIDLRDESKQMQKAFKLGLTASFREMIDKMDIKLEEIKKRYDKEKLILISIVILTLISIALNFILK